ncbi:diacylglycerol O-acyltransferase domain protein [Mycobacterium kansasii]|uniref:Diacylglycerol O-acyltransferase domain protein n=1 Tax=Mycobacterium kansasii TaxID=1768 RepID=A0A1V3WMW9_MYCKA|nr:diacylglycerol O-acyltransferase domain protein [Mycobacterium kansasii]
MEHLTALDAAFLEVEDSDPHVSLAIGGLSIIEGLCRHSTSSSRVWSSGLR